MTLHASSLLLPLVVATCLPADPPDPDRAEPIDPPDPPIVERLRAEAEALAPLVETPLAKAFLGGTATLPPGEARVVYRDETSREIFSETAAAAMPEDGRRAALRRIELDEDTYYTTKYGSPLAYVRALEIAGQAGLASVEDARILDLGYGTVGHLRLLAGLGADAVGVDVDPFLPALYSKPHDQGRVGRGTVTLVDGHWPGDESVADAAGTGFRLFLSKNTLKRGYIHPEREVDPARLVHLGVDDETFCRAVHRVLEPGGLFVIYNLSPAQNPPDQPYLPWADGRCPFDRDLLARCGFEVLAYDVEDHDAARAVGAALGWAEGDRPMDLDELFAHYAVLRKR